MAKFDQNGRTKLTDREKKRAFEQISGTVRDEMHVTTILLKMKTYGTIGHVNQRIEKLQSELALQGIDVDIISAHTELEKDNVGE